jgi:hypothetical protein
MGTKPRRYERYATPALTTRREAISTKKGGVSPAASAELDMVRRRTNQPILYKSLVTTHSSNWSTASAILMDTCF